MEISDFNLNIIYHFLKPITMQTFYVLTVISLLIAGFALFILPRFLKSEKNIFLRMKNRLFGEFEYHQKDKDTP